MVIVVQVLGRDMIIRYLELWMKEVLQDSKSRLPYHSISEI